MLSFSIRQRFVQILAVWCVAVTPLAAQSAESAVRTAVEQYNLAMTTKNLVVLRSLLAEDVVLYEHSVRNVGIADVWDNHLRPEVEEFDNAKATFTSVRVTADAGMALVTREYDIRATVKGKPITAAGNETMVWVYRNSRWVVKHIHYSHPCARPQSPTPQ